MSRKERERLTIMTGVKREELTLVQAGELMAVCYRQSKRIWRRYQDDGDAGLVHRLRGKPIQTGEFGADMLVELLNDGPVTIMIDSKLRE